jgi:hypothetical protein
MADSLRMALAEPVRQRGQKGGPLRSQLVPAAAKGPRHPQGRSELGERSRPRNGLDGERGRGRLQAGKRPPVTHSGLLTETAIAWFFFGVEPEKENHHDGRECEHGISGAAAQGRCRA